MVEERLTLSQLAERSGVEARTLRSWMQQGVVPGPETVGRNARYAPSTLTRVLAVKAMRDLYGLSLAEIRRDLLAADAERIAGYAAMAARSGSLAQEGPGGSFAEDGKPGPASGPPEAPSPASPSAPPPAASSAADYLRSLRAAGVYGASQETPRGARGASGRFSIQPSPRRRGAEKASFEAPEPLPPNFMREEAAPPPAAPGPGGSRVARLAQALERVAGPRPARRKARGEVRLHIPITPDLELTVRGEHSPEEIARFEQVADLLRTILTGGSEND